MQHTLFKLQGWRMLSALIFSLLGAACGDGGDNGFSQQPGGWSWTDLGGPPATVSEFASNHEPLLVVDETLLLGTADGVWQRPLAGAPEWERAGLDGFAVLALALIGDRERIIAAGFDPDDDSAPSAWYSSDAGLSWVAAAEWPRGEPGGPVEGLSFPFYALEPDPVDADVVYANLEADSIAVTVDAGATWFLTNGATETNFGFPCVPHRPASVAVLLQGCELPLDIAWVGARRVIEDDRFQLPDFRFLYGYPDLEELSNRRINSMAAISERDDQVLIGVEGGLVSLTSTSGEWEEDADVTARWIFRAEDDTSTPYAYIRAIAPLDAAGRQILFGGALNGDNLELSLFETSNGGQTVVQLEPPSVMHDPRVEQAWRLGANDVLLVISQIESNDPDGSLAPHSPKVYRLQRP